MNNYTKIGSQNIYINDTIGNMSSMIAETCMVYNDNLEISSSRPIIWKATINIVMSYQTNIDNNSSYSEKNYHKVDFS